MPENPNPNAVKQAVQTKITALMDRVMNKVLVVDPFIKEEFRAEKPLYAALVPSEIFKGSHFERRFVTPFGFIWEELARAAGIASGLSTERGHSIHGTVRRERLRRIQETLDRLEHPEKGKIRIKPNWDEELRYVLEGGGEQVPVEVVCDIFTHDKTTKTTHAFELKAPLPNSDQTKVSKEKILKLYAMEPRQVTSAYFALPYNPYGKREDYNWSFPARWFDMKKDKVVLIGNEFWEELGGKGTYESFVEAVNEIGAPYKERIYREFLGIEPPVDGLTIKL